MATVNSAKGILGCENISQLMKRIVSAQSLTTFGRSGNYGCALGDVKFFVKIALYSLFVHDLWKKPPPPTSMMVDAEINMMRAIKTRIIDRGHCPHFVEILAISRCENIAQYVLDKDKCEQQQLGRVRADNHPQSLFCTFLDSVAEGKALDKFALVFSEYCEFNIKEFLMRYAPLFPSVRDTMIQSILFQVYYSLFVAQRLWPHFRHGDLLPHNIMVKVAHVSEEYLTRRHYLQYEIDGRVWNVPFFGFFIKIIDFGHGEIPEEGIINSVRRAGDAWIPDHIAFITNFESMVYEAQFMSPELRLMFNALNREHLTPIVSAAQLIRLESTFETPVEAIESAFSMLSVEVEPELIIHKYNAPPPPETQ
jgi:hypothetical protein